MNFTSVEEVYFSGGQLREHGLRTRTRAEMFLSAQWKFPKLHTLSIRDFRWTSWWNFFETHSQTLKILSLTTYGNPFWPKNKIQVNLPALECFYMDCYDISITIVAGKVTHVGCHRVGCDGDPDRGTTEDDKAKSLRRLLSTFDYWRHFPAATTYRITGRHEVLEWLDERPGVIKRVASYKTHGVDVKFIHMDKDSYR
jgi:hypothetical protein